MTGNAAINKTGSSKTGAVLKTSNKMAVTSKTGEVKIVRRTRVVVSKATSRKISKATAIKTSKVVISKEEEIKTSKGLINKTGNKGRHKTGIRISNGLTREREIQMMIKNN